MVPEGTVQIMFLTPTGKVTSLQRMATQAFPETYTCRLHVFHAVINPETTGPSTNYFVSLSSESQLRKHSEENGPSQAYVNASGPQQAYQAGAHFVQRGQQQRSGASRESNNTNTNKGNRSSQRQEGFRSQQNQYLQEALNRDLTNKLLPGVKTGENAASRLESYNSNRAVVLAITTRQMGFGVTCIFSALAQLPANSGWWETLVEGGITSASRAQSFIQVHHMKRTRYSSICLSIMARLPKRQVGGRPYQNYTQRNLKKAVLAVRKGMSLRDASTQYEVPTFPRKQFSSVPT
ncbi:unnamed protein product [Bemisia tabaci]|uniref:Uncharacterized protein n=1 Tax=Bemisia tabaci TaxID=7038 RepID=A0A9P0EWQ6_BEMTA|nr:unnamed protein product [Bemisia tabaci]